MLFSTANAQWNSTRSNTWWSQTEASLDNIITTGLSDSTDTKFILGNSGDTLQVRGKFYFWRGGRYVPEDSLYTIEQLDAWLDAQSDTSEYTQTQIDSLLGLVGQVQTHTITTDSTLAAGLMYGGIFYVPEAQTITLPAVASGMNAVFITVGAVAVSIDLNASDKFVLDGTTLSDGDKITNTSTTGDMVVITYYSADGFYAASGSNDGDLWTDGN